MIISKELAQDILDHMSCEGTKCDECSLKDTNCADHHKKTADTLRAILEDEKQNSSVSRETRPKLGPPDLGLLEPGKATKYITIPVAEYHFLTKAATLLEIIMADKSYSPNTVVAAVRTVVQEMVQQAEAGAAE